MTTPFGIATYKVNFHTVHSSREGLTKCILRDVSTDVWCLQGVNLSKQLKSLPSTYGTAYQFGMAFVHSKERMHLIEADSANMVPALLKAADERPSVADSFCVSRFHLSNLKIFAGFAAYTMRPVSSSTPSAKDVASDRILIVNIDLEKFCRWGNEFQCNLLHVLCRFIWGGNSCFTRRWMCTHVCIAGSFFFTPGSLPYRALTSLSGGCVETIATQVVVPPFKRLMWEREENGGLAEPDAAAAWVCVVVAEAHGSSRCQQLLAVRLCGDAVSGPVEPLTRLCVFYLNAATGEYEAEKIGRDEEGWWTLLTPRDTSVTDHIVLRLEWHCSEPAASAAQRDAQVSVQLRVRSFGVLPPLRQDAGGLPVGQALLCSGTAHSVSSDAATRFCATLQQRHLPSEHLMELCSNARRVLGEPVVTALYRDGAEALPDCYDYIFVSTFTGAVVQDAARLTVDDFDAETATPHLPISCTVAIPCGARQ